MTTRTFIRPRAYDKRVTIERQATSKGSAGGFVTSWEPLLSHAVWASIRNKSGSRGALTSKGGEVADGTHEIEMRYRSGVEPLKTRIRHGNVIYTIIHANNLLEQNEVLLLTCETGVVRA